MRTIFMTSFLCLSTVCAFAQTLDRVEFSSGGASTSLLSVSLGESFNAVGTQLTVGSQQFGKTINTSVSNISNIINIATISPNPTASGVLVNVEGDYKNDFAIRIIDVMGRELFYQEHFSASAQVDVSTFSSGVFFVMILGNQKNIFFNQTIIKQ